MPRLLFSVCAVAVFATACAQSDAGITTSVKTQLAADDAVKASRIDVDTHDRVVTLTGRVGSPDAERKALEIARTADGVRDVIDQLDVVPEPEPTPTTGIADPAPEPRTDDASITVAVKSKLLADPDTSGLRIDVDTVGRVVTLTGELASQAEKKEALEIAREVQGVKSVVDRLTVKKPR